MTRTPAIPDQTDETAELYKSVIGSVNQNYYLRVFAHFDAKGRTGILWHWPAFFSTLNWLVFRKMWGMAAWFAGLSLVFMLVVFGVGKLVFSFSEATAGILTGVSLLLAFVLPGLFANAAYYRFCERTINSVLVTGVGVPDACGILAQRASSRKRLLRLAALNLVVLAMLVTLATWVTGAYQERKMRPLRTEFPQELNSGAEAVKPPLAASSASVAASALIPATAPAVAGVQVATTVALPSIQEVSAPVVSSPVASAPALPAVEPAVPSSPVPAQTEPARGSSMSRRIEPQYFIQVGAFANLQNARKVMTQLEAMGLDAGAAPVVVTDGRLTRIRVGPFTTRAEAAKAADQIKKQGLPALFVKL